MKPLISVIVPIYNVEQYLPRCIESILNQTYKNLEVILVDDGATDHCGSICDVYKEKDCRVRVIHKSNGGLSDARNAGLDRMTGEYVTCIDSDDFVSPFFVENLWLALEENHCDIASSWFIEYHKLHVFDKDWPELPFAHREHIGCTVDYVAGRNRYMGYLISLGIYSFKGVKVGLDCANGASWNIAKSVFDALGADTYVINNKPNGLNINNNAGSTHIEGLQKFIVEKGLDVGFAYDGDADRCLCVDEKGNVVTGDHILYIYGCYMKERGKLLTNTVVTTVMSNFGLYKAFDEQGIGYARTAVGDKYVYEYMAKNGCRIGGEQSGHIIFSKYASTGDGILTSLKMMEVMLAKKKPMSKLAEPLKIYPQVLENVRVTDKKAAQNDPAVQEAVSKVAEALGDTGRILVRESGTEPVVRVMVEAPDHDTCQKYVDEVVDVIRDRGYSL